MLLKAKSLCLKLHNAALCTDLIDQIHTIQENRLPLTCPEKEFKKCVDKGVERFLESCVSVSKANEKAIQTDLQVLVPEVKVTLPGDVNPTFSTSI